MLVNLVPQIQFLGHSGVLHISTQDFHLPCFLKAQSGTLAAPVGPNLNEGYAVHTHLHIQASFLKSVFLFYRPRIDDLQQCSLQLHSEQELIFACKIDLFTQLTPHTINFLLQLKKKEKKKKALVVS